MATRTFIGNAVAVAQVRTWVFAGTWEVGDIIEFKPTGGTVIYSYAVTSTTIATFLPLLVTALNALTSTQYPQISEMTWSSSSPNLTATGDTAGVPFDITITTRDAGGAADSQTIDGGASSAGTDSTACSGPNFLNVAANWSGATLPVDGDKVIIDGSTTKDILYGLDMSGVTPAQLWIYQSYRGRIGLTDINTTISNGEYNEYRETFMKWGNSGDATNLDFQYGIGSGVGSSRARINFGTGQFTGNIFNTGQAADINGAKALELLGTHASNALNIKKGSVAIAPLASQTSNIDTLRISYVNQIQTDVSCFCGPGCTVENVTEKSGGYLIIENPASTNVYNGEGITELNGTGAAADITVEGGKVYVNSNGTISGTVTVYVDGGLDFSRDLRAKSITNTIQSYCSNPVNDPEVVVNSGGDLVINLLGKGIGGLGDHVQITRSAVS